MKITISFLLRCTNLQSKHFSIFIFGLFFLFAPVSASAETTDLDEDSIPDHEDQEVVVYTSQSLSAGEYFFHNLTIASSAVLTLAGDPDTPGDFKGVKISADNITIENGSSLSANGTGHASLEESPGGGESGGGYGYGGDGGDWHYKTSSALGGDAYGSSFEPKDLGSGGSINAGGGGAIWLAVSGTLKNNGIISANGALQQASGGSIYVQTGLLEGAGMFTANGARCAGWPYSGAGGGGRIAVYYGSSGFTGSAEAFRGGVGTNTNCQGERTGQDGTVVFIDTTNNDLYLYDRLLFQANGSPYEFNRIVLLDSSTISSEPGVSITAHTVSLNEGSSFNTDGIHSFTTDDLLIDGSSTFTSAEGQSLTISSLTLHNRGIAQLGRGETLNAVTTVSLEGESQIIATPMHILHLDARDITIDETSAISATGAGYPPRTGPGYNDSGSGASYGGLGERGTPSPIYGSETEPIDFGSGGSPDSYGGGVLRMIVSGTLENNGTISADATPMKNGASGGSVYVTTNKLSGSGSFTALGGNTRGYTTDVGAGGGGRIAVYYKESDFVGTTSAKGGDRYVGGSSMNWYYAQDGTIVFAKEEPQGISNILFLPGIQASRLYTKVDGNEERIWEPGGNADVEKLRMTESGESITDIYTIDVVDEKGGIALGGDVYKGFLQHLINLDGPTGGPLVTTFPYDWRYDVFDIIEKGTKTENGNMIRPTDVIATSASLSPTGKVTLIAHSNGGLLAKAIMLKLEEEGNADLVDKVIFIASPHTGTPKGLAALLHGFDQELFHGLLADDEVVRGVMKNMPGVYGLLPSEEYFTSLTEPMISFDGSSTTALYRNSYGFAVSNMDEYASFLRGGEGRADAGNRVNEISTANSGMLDNALSHHREQLDSWSAPSGVQVFNIVGTGLPTSKSIEYREFMDMSCTMYGCTRTKKLEPVIHFTRYGDKTVVSKSAGALVANGLFLDLSFAEDYEHVNITESEITQTLIDHILHGSSTEGINFVSNTEPVFANDFDIHTIHSPARIYVRDSNGNITGRTEEGGEWQTGIPESDYFEVGGVKYVLVPSTGAYTVTVEGEGTGVYTHMLTTLTNETEAVQHAFTASITPTSIIQYTKTDDTISTISIDENGDGSVDKNMTLTGEIIKEEITYDDLEEAIQALNLSRKYERPLLELVRNAERLSNHRSGKHWKKHGERALLHTVEELLERYKKMRLITKNQYNEIEDIIEELIEKKYE